MRVVAESARGQAVTIGASIAGLSAVWVLSDFIYPGDGFQANDTDKRHQNLPEPAPADQWGKRV
ncbi:hypothetical protein [Mycobacterium uberis]|uniref:hypothetical protein n=1 Tax=Mycobacterium uberis TaxID=2162698 RepID=UPI001FB53A7E|nr:hypothetical protein [Mycobacterium uberis]